MELHKHMSNYKHYILLFYIVHRFQFVKCKQCNSIVYNSIDYTLDFCLYIVFLFHSFLVITVLFRTLLEQGSEFCCGSFFFWISMYECERVSFYLIIYSRSGSFAKSIFFYFHTFSYSFLLPFHFKNVHNYFTGYLWLI